MNAEALSSYLSRPLAPPGLEVLAAIDAGPIHPSDGLPLERLDWLLGPAELRAETGWCTLPDGVGYVAVRTPMAGVTGEMVDWWFDWHQRDPLRYRVWYPGAHQDTSFEPPGEASAKAYWGAVHYPVEDIGIGMDRIRIAFRPPTALGFSTDALEHPDVATIVCGLCGDPGRHVQHSVMAHVFLRAEEGLVLRSRFWLGAVIRPDLPGPLAAAASVAVNHKLIRKRLMPASAPLALARHSAVEYANLAALLPELYERYGPLTLGYAPTA